ncbi:MAG TPA: hypothetical protein VN692_10130, partial [Steroidobacteraceae bacterium]|nr:hypothetical protein [Steroidobacteraceae bacterium]
ASVGVVYRVKRHGQPAPLASDGNRKLFTGTVADTINDIRAVRDIGVTALDFDFEGRDAARSTAQMQRFRDEVLDRL